MKSAAPPAVRNHDDTPRSFPAGRQAQQQAQMMKFLFGPGGKLVAWIVPADEHHVVSGYVARNIFSG